MYLGDAITTKERLFLVSAEKAEKLFPKWGDQAEFFSKRNTLQANISNIQVLSVEVKKKEYLYE